MRGETMTNREAYLQELNDLSATVVMGWHKVNGRWRDSEGNLPDGPVFWNPIGNWRDTKIIIRKMQEDSYRCCVLFRDDVLVSFYRQNSIMIDAEFAASQEMIAITAASIIAKGGELPEHIEGASGYD